MSKPGLNNSTNTQNMKDIQGGEKKVMKKSLTVILSSAMALSMLASVAMADTTTSTTTTPTSTTAPAAVKTSKDFTDLKGLDPALVAKIDVLLAKGYMEGKTDTTFDVTGNMTRAEAAKLVVKVLNLTVNPNATSSFSDVSATDGSISWAIPYIEAAKALGVIDGMTDATATATATFAPKENVTIGQLATMFVKALGKKADVKQTAPWYQGYMDVAKANGVDLGIDGAKAATRTDLVVGSYAADVAIQATKVPAKASVSSAKATGVKTVTVSFDKAVDKTKATLALKKGSLAIATTTAFADDMKSATLTLTDTKLTAGAYTVTLGGLDATAIDKSSADFTAVDEAVSKIDFINASDTLARSSNVVVKLKATNQYGENASFSAGSYTVYAGNNNDVLVKLTKNDAGELLLTLNTAVQANGVDKYQPGISVIPVNIYNNDSHVTASKNFKMGTAPFITKMELGTVKYSNGTSALTGTGESATIDVLQYDQYGNLIPYSAADDTNIRVTFNAYEPALTYVVGDSNNDGTADVKISLSSNVDKSQDYTFTVYNQAGTATATVSVKSAKVANKVELGEATDVIAAGDTSAYIPLIAYDSAGTQLSTDDLVSTQNVSRINISVPAGLTAALQTSGTNKGKVKITGIPTTPKTVISVTAVIAQPNASSVATKTYTVADVRIPDHFTVSTDAKKGIVPGSATANTVNSFKFLVFDQYGKQLDTVQNVDAAGNVTASTATGVAQYQVTVTGITYDGSIDLSLDAAASPSLASTGTGKNTVYGNEAGAAGQLSVLNGGFRFTALPSANHFASFKAAIQKSVNGGTTWQELSSVTRQINAISSTQSLTYSVNTVSDLFNAIDTASVTDATYDAGLAPLTAVTQKNPLTSKFAKQVSLSAIDASGNSVALPDAIQSITTSNPNIAKVDVLAGKAYVIGNKAGTATLNVAYLTSNGTQALKTVTVNVKDTLIQSTKVTAGNSGRTPAQVILDGNNAFVTMDLIVTDNYGVTYEKVDAQKYNYLFGVTFSVSNIVGGTVSVDKYGAITASAGVTSYDLTATSAAGFSATTAVSN